MTNQTPVDQSAPKPQRPILGCLSAALGSLAVVSALISYRVVASVISAPVGVDVPMGPTVLFMASAAGYALCLPPALILGIIAALQKRRTKTFAIVGLVLSGLALLPLGYVVVMLALARLGKP